jgi:hypothetical protein
MPRSVRRHKRISRKRTAPRFLLLPDPKFEDHRHDCERDEGPEQELTEQRRIDPSQCARDIHIKTADFDWEATAKVQAKNTIGERCG